jgi:hypothetical protein
VIKGDFAFGRILRIVPLNPEAHGISLEQWDEAVTAASEEYCHHMVGC